MKRYRRKLAWILLFCSLLLCACNRQTGNNDIADVTEPEVAETNANGVAQLQVGAAGVLYGINEAGTQIAPLRPETGALLEPLVETVGLQCFCYNEGAMYYVAVNQLCQRMVDSGEITELAVFGGTEFAFGKMTVAGGQIFVLSRNEEGTLWSYNPEKDVLEKLPDICAKSIAAKGADELLIYAQDDEGMAYVMAYDVPKKTFSKKQYIPDRIEGVTDLAYDETLELLLFLNDQGIWMAFWEALSDAVFAYDGNGAQLSSLQCRDGKTYALSRGEQGSVICVENQSVNFEIPALKVYTLDEFKNTPDCGFNIQFEEITANELRLKILAGDTDYDFLLLDSQWDLGYHVARIGAYSALNDISRVEEFLEECHEFAGKAATLEDGTIWMLPYEVYGTVLCYNETLFQELGLTLSDIDTVEEVYTLAEKVIEEDSAYVDLLPALLASNMLNKYLANYGMKDGYASYNTEQFRQIAEIRKQHEMKGYDGSVNYRTLAAASPLGNYTKEQRLELYREVYQKTLLTIVRTEDMQTQYLRSDNNDVSQYDFLHAAPMPDLEDGVDLKEEVEVGFLVINPNSDKLPWVKKYVETLCEELRTDETSFLLKNNTFPEQPIFEEVMEILSEAEVTFLYPTSIVSDSMKAFLMEGQSLEDCIEEIERVMNMYMHE